MRVAKLYREAGDANHEDKSLTPGGMNSLASIKLLPLLQYELATHAAVLLVLVSSFVLLVCESLDRMHPVTISFHQAPTLRWAGA